MKLFCATSLLASVGILACAQTAFASNGTIAFDGEITAATCTITNANNGNYSVALPKLSSSVFHDIADTAGWTAFDIKLTGCSPASGSVQAYFEAGPTVDAESGRLNNLAADGADVQIQLRDLDGTTPIAVGSASAQFESINPDGTATLNYIAGYYALAAAVNPGLVTSSVTYTLAYQ
uniref:fimbrial protein n=1 Tax=Castellaniella defragrans TaxID=75697 RepID=UPI00333F15AF